MTVCSRTSGQTSLAAAMAYIDTLTLDERGADADALEAIADWGRYDGLPPKVILLDDGRKARLVDPIAYHRPDGSAWPVPANSLLDGASIPRFLWSVIGGPFEGKYRIASIVHDYYCDARSRRWEDTHRMFHDAMRCSGVGQAKAKMMFYAVYRFGPRWLEAGLEGFGGDVAAVAANDRDAVSLVSDAEAITGHGLNLDEIAALADARRAGVQESPLEGFNGDRERARLLVVAGGSGTAEDIATVAAQAASLPALVVDHFFDAGVRIIACRDSVTDFETDLRGKIPRGWESTGRTWDGVPGAYFDDRKRVVIATAAGPGGRVVPDKTSRLHGSDNLVVHESLHGYDYSLRHAPLADPRFTAARNSDLGGLSDYERQAGQAGLEETYAETGAQFCVARPSLDARCPALAGYWEAALSAAIESVLPPPPADEGKAPLGTATREANGAILLDLRATAPGGAIGHALLVVEPGDPAHPELDAKLFPDAALEGTGGATALFFG